MAKKLDLLLLNVGGIRKKIYQDLSEDYSAIETPFWAALTASYFSKQNYGVEILDANAMNMDFYETAEIIKGYDPKLINIVGYGQHPSASTSLMTGIGRQAKIIKQQDPERKIILTGIHASALPQKTLLEEDIDYVAKGEGFQTIKGLLEDGELSKIPGLWYSKDNIVMRGPASSLMKNLTELPGITWDMLPMDKYKAHNWHSLHDLDSRLNYAAISTTLGCPFTCDFCCINTPFGKSSYRSWSPEWTLNQIDILVNKYNVKNLKFIDELFVLNPNHFMPIVEGIKERGYGLNIWAYARIDTTKNKYLDALKNGGINWLGVGIESGAENIRRQASKGRFEQEDIRGIVEKIKNHGINVGGNYIFGLTDDTNESMKKTLDLAKELNCEWANFYSAMAYPGSQLHLKSQGKNILPEDFPEIGWGGYSQYSYDCFPLSTKKLSNVEVLRFRDQAFNEYFKSEKYLRMIKQKFGEKARKHLENMTKIKLERKLLQK